MAGYVIADIDVKDSSAYEGYREQVAPSLERYGGRFLVRGGKAESLEGAWAPRRIVVVEFDSVARARQWWSSREYEGPKRIRQRAAVTNLVVVEGIPGDGERG